MLRFYFNSCLTRWELSRQDEVLMVWEGDLAKEEVEFWTNYTKEKNAQKIPRLGFGET